MAYATQAHQTPLVGLAVDLCNKSKQVKFGINSLILNIKYRPTWIDRFADTTVIRQYA